ncbi:MAG: hypothetical protein AAFV90_11380 [Cyanobacteria bacterium J06634_5]
MSLRRCSQWHHHTRLTGIPGDRMIKYVLFFGYGRGQAIALKTAIACPQNRLMARYEMAHYE